MASVACVRACLCAEVRHAAKKLNAFIIETVEWEASKRAGAHNHTTLSHSQATANKYADLNALRFMKFEIFFFLPQEFRVLCETKWIHRWFLDRWFVASASYGNRWEWSAHPHRAHTHTHREQNRIVIYLLAACLAAGIGAALPGGPRS